MSNLIVLCGLPASTKSTFAKELQRMYTNSVIVSSDEMRERTYGDERIQGDNNKLFEAIYAEIISFLKDGKTVIFDATNILAKNRIHLLNTVGKYATEKHCVVVATPYHKCLEFNSRRTRFVPEQVINHMWKQFTCPQYYEGWNTIEIIYPVGYDTSHYTIKEYLGEADVFEQDNYHHTMTLGNHTKAVADFIKSKTTDERIIYSALLHDNGKLYTKTFKNMKGEDTEIAHYYNHNNVGAYESLFYLKNENIKTNDIVWISGIIGFHMRPHSITTDKAKKKFVDLVGEKMYADIMILHEADVVSH